MVAIRDQEQGGREKEEEWMMREDEGFIAGGEDDESWIATLEDYIIAGGEDGKSQGGGGGVGNDEQYVDSWLATVDRAIVRKEYEEEEEEYWNMKANELMLLLSIPGVAFAPEAQELIPFLERKVTGKSIPDGLISEFDVYTCDPWNILLPPSLHHEEEEEERAIYVFTQRHIKKKRKMGDDDKYCNGRFIRVAGCGVWHGYGKDKEIWKDGKVVGHTTALQFKKTITSTVEGNNKEKMKTNWIMHEFRLPNHKITDVVLCKIYELKKTSDPARS